MKEETIRFRVSAEEKQKAAEAFADQGVKLSEGMRLVLLRYLRRAGKAKK